MIYYLLAMQKEFDKLDVSNKFLIGMNATSVPKLTDEDIIVNIGYCGSLGLKVGSIVEPSYAINMDSGKKYKVDSIFNYPKYPCYTSSTFVEQTDITQTCIFDMELAKLASLPHKKLYSLKIVSDNLSEADFDAYDPDQVWIDINSMLKPLFS